MPDEVGRTLIGPEAIAARVRELGACISRDYRRGGLLTVCVLKGAAIFWSDLCRQVELPLEAEFVALESYRDATRPEGDIRLTKDCDRPLAGKDVLIVEDIIDTGRTVTLLRRLLAARGPRSLKLCALLDKAERREVPVEIDYCGFVIPNEFVVGYGLDYAQRHRNLPYVAALRRRVEAG